jgi:hypothetical protein
MAGDLNRRDVMLNCSASAIIVVCLLLSPVAAGQQGPARWLDGPLTNWNKAGQAAPTAPQGDETVTAVIARCQLMPLRSSSAERAVASAGWVPFLYFDYFPFFSTNRCARRFVTISAV